MIRSSMSVAMIVVAIAFSPAAAGDDTPKNSDADAELIDVIRHSFVPNTFDAATMSDESRVYLIADGKYTFLDKTEIVKTMNEAKSAHAERKIDRFDVTNFHFGGEVAAISYVIDVRETEGNKDTTMEYVCSDIWTKVSGKYVLLFGTAEAKNL